MAQDLKPCLMWETGRPHMGGSRQSSYFKMLGTEWYFELSLSPFLINSAFCKIILHGRHGERTLETALSAACRVVAGGMEFGSSEQRTVRKSGSCVFGCFVPKKHISSSENFIKWTVYCRLSCVGPLSLQINNETMHLPTDPAPTFHKSVHLQCLSDDFSRLLDEGIGPDATLECGGRTWSVHRSVLGVRSEVFAAMFRSGMAESLTGAVCVDDLEATVLDSLLKYVYCGEVPDLSDQNVSGLYEAGDRYALHGLRKACSDWMVENLSEEKCLSCYVTADAHGDAYLKDAIASFVAEHYAEIGSEVWSNFTREHPFLAIAVLQRFAPPKEV